MLNLKIGDVSFDAKTFTDILKDTVILPEKRKEIESLLYVIMEIHGELLALGDSDVAKKYIQRLIWYLLVHSWKMPLSRGETCLR